ncbi:MAG: hypothetical protein MPJ78_07970 [Hyphomicrobiaceae bacterium]|nr:hypothetical protein [Hyphomicrobiaceae bacterium]
MSESPEPAGGNSRIPLRQTDVNLLRVAAAFGAYCVVVVLVLIGASNESWDTFSTVLLVVAALIGWSVWLCLSAAGLLSDGQQPRMRLPAALAVGILILLTPVMALFIFWVSISMQMANTGLANYPLFTALCIGAVLLIVMQILILLVAYRARKRPLA